MAPGAAERGAKALAVDEQAGSVIRAHLTARPASLPRELETGQP
jgi:hypothetical protein